MLTLLIGNIASGKSTYCREKAAEGAIIVNDDAIVAAVHGGDYTLYSKDLKPLYKTVENTIVSVALAIGKDVIIDRPNLTVPSRRRFIALAQSLDIKVKAVVFPFMDPLVHADRRVKHDSRGYDYSYWFDVAHQKHIQYIAPLHSEGFDFISHEEEK